MVERQRDGQYRVRLKEDERIIVSNIPTRALAEDIDKVLSEAYQLGTKSYRADPPWNRDDYDD